MNNQTHPHTLRLTDAQASALGTLLTLALTDPDFPYCWGFNGNKSRALHGAAATLAPIRQTAARNLNTARAKRKG